MVRTTPSGSEVSLVASAAASLPGGVVPRPSAQPRPWVRPHLYIRDAPLLVTSAQVRTYWTAAMGPQAVADLMRLVRAAQLGKRLRRPHRLPALAQLGLVVWAGGELWVSEHIPLPPEQMIPRSARLPRSPTPTA